jgi:predicted RNA methylase
MTLTDINKALSNLAEQPTRENILAFSFELLHWMNITPNADNKPQLLSPQTQKLKDYLGNAPQTVQPQLYRLSADNQQIRVRFAVLKKLKKEYISQLVDNDPGLGSYQAMAKGLTTPTTGTAFIPAQPYFIHFVTTPDYDKLVLIFNQGEQKRIVSFRNRLTNTQYHKIIQAWQGIGSKAKPEIADLLWKSLDIKEVNKEFYKQIKERFDALLGIVKTQHNTATENQVKQFTVRMIGRYIFCWFLKEKGIIPLSLISKQTIESTEKYYQTVLLKLFFETLNTKVQDRDPLKHNKLFEKIPYLNGGLFDESEEDKLFTKLDLDAWLLPFVEILESYDFTVDESSSQYQQVAVDPEMLGRIFENLLASQNEETEKLANQRKAFGAFYTPREIVDYMVNESIKAFLQTQWEQHLEADKTKHINNPVPIGDIFGNKKPQQLAIETKRYQLKPEEKQKIEKALEPLFASNPDAGHLKKEEKTLLLGFLEQIKILDPACGSGAFPMGILHKLVELHEALGTVKSSYELKKDILSQNIYGVDIMPMAIEIARLRAWLSLVLEEDYKPNDPKHNFGVKPLPNLDFKFVCANSLIDLGLDAFIQESKGTLHEGFTQKLVKDLKDLETLRTNFFNPTLASSQKEQLKTDYFEKRDKVIVDIEAAHDPILKHIAQKIKHWNPFDDSKPSLFFSPTWMFGIDGGFSVVIGNPPYGVSIKKTDNPVYAEQYKEILKGEVESYILFYYKGLKVLSKNGFLSFITPDSWFTNKGAAPFRKYLTNNHSIKDVYDIYKPFEAAKDTRVHTVLIGVSQTTDEITVKQVHPQNTEFVYRNYSIPSKVITDFLDSEWRFYINKQERNIFSKMESKSQSLESLFNIKYGLRTGDNEKYVTEKETEYPLIAGADIASLYQVKWKPKFLKHKDGLPESYFNEYFSTKKIIIQYVRTNSLNLNARWIEAAYVEGNFIPLNSLNYVYDKSENFSLMYLLGILNSFLMNKYYRAYYTDVNVKPTYLSQLPIPNISSKQQQPFILRVEKINSMKKKNHDTTLLEKEIDVLVYHLYELTYDEVKIIDKEFWLSEEEYEKMKVS